jgi:hypothetical protein
VVVDAGGVSVIGSGRAVESAVSMGIRLVKCIISKILDGRQGEKLGY